MAIGDRIKAARKAKDLTLEELASALKLSRQTLSRYENGIISNIPSDKIEKLAEVLNTSPAYLMGWDSDNSTIPDEIDFDDFTFALYGEVRYLDDEAKAEILKTAQRFNELRKLKAAAQQ